MKKVSIIVPVYNMEKRLATCVDSLLAQTYSNIEIILIDDGSKDNSARICDNYKKSSDKILVIHKENGGFADASNFGLDQASGDYIMFVDSDDYIDNIMVQKLVETSEKDQADIVQCGLKFVDENNLLMFQHNHVHQRIEGNHNVVEAYLIGTIIDRMLAGKLIAANLFGSARFVKGHSAADVILTFSLLQKCKKITIMEENYYTAVQLSASVSRGEMTDKKYEDQIICSKFINDSIRNNYAELESYLFYKTVESSLFLYERVKRSKKITHKSAKLKECKELFHSAYKRLLCDANITKYPKGILKLSKLFSIHPSLYLLGKRVIAVQIKLRKNGDSVGR